MDTVLKPAKKETVSLATGVIGSRAKRLFVGGKIGRKRLSIKLSINLFKKNDIKGRQTSAVHFQISTTKPQNINPAPMMILGVSGSLSSKKESTKVIKILPLSIAAT